MQSLNWYAKRMAAMSPEEIGWRLRAKLRSIMDRALVERRARPDASRLNGAAHDFQPGFAVFDGPAGCWLDDPQARELWAPRLLQEAERVRAHRLRLFDLEDQYLGDPIDWNREHKAGVAAPLTFAPSIDYRDTRVTGDCKFVWEPNRCYHLVVLARAYRALGRVEYAEEVVRQIESWMEQCPYGRGMNWRSPLELAIRVINWVWAVDLIRPSGLVQGAFLERLLQSAYLHLWETARSFSRGSSANNHLIGEAAGVFVGASYFTTLRDARSWRELAREVLEQEIQRQTHADGGNREQAFSYHMFVLQFFVVAGSVARRTGRDFSQQYWRTLERKFEFAAALRGGGEPPLYGDADDGYVLDVGAGPLDFGAWLACGESLFGRGGFITSEDTSSEVAYWLGCKQPAQPGRSARLPSLGFADTGIYLLQHGKADAKDRISLTFDCGELGYTAIAAHGHADALSFTLRVGGQDVFVDPGTFDYFTYPEWREYFRSTRAHNTAVLDGRDQSEMLGLFLWGRRARARCVSWKPSADGGSVCGEHDGYMNLPDPVRHRREIELCGEQGQIFIRDFFECNKNHSVALYFQLAEGVACEPKGKGCRLQIDRTCVDLVASTDAEWRMERGSTAPIAGWVSRGYHRKARSTTLIAEGRITGSQEWRTKLSIVNDTRESGEPGSGAFEEVQVVLSPKYSHG